MYELQTLRAALDAARAVAALDPWSRLPPAGPIVLLVPGQPEATALLGRSHDAARSLLLMTGERSLAQAVAMLTGALPPGVLPPGPGLLYRVRFGPAEAGPLDPRHPAAPFVFSAQEDGRPPRALEQPEYPPLERLLGTLAAVLRSEIPDPDLDPESGRYLVIRAETNAASARARYENCSFTPIPPVPHVHFPHDLEALPRLPDEYVVDYRHQPDGIDPSLPGVRTLAILEPTQLRTEVLRIHEVDDLAGVVRTLADVFHGRLERTQCGLPRRLRIQDVELWQRLAPACRPLGIECEHDFAEDVLRPWYEGGSFRKNIEPALDAADIETMPPHLFDLHEREDDFVPGDDPDDEYELDEDEEFDVDQFVMRCKLPPHHELVDPPVGVGAPAQMLTDVMLANMRFLALADGAERTCRNPKPWQLYFGQPRERTRLDPRTHGCHKFLCYLVWFLSRYRSAPSRATFFERWPESCRIPPLHALLIEALTKSVASVYRIVEVDVARTTTRIEDLWTGAQRVVHDPDLPSLQPPGTIFAARVFRFLDQGCMALLSPFFAAYDRLAVLRFLEQQLETPRGKRISAREEHVFGHLWQLFEDRLDLFLDLHGEAERGIPLEELDPVEREQLVERWFLAWVDEALPELGGQSPREAARGSLGRQAIERILPELPARLQLEGFAFPLATIRAELGLDARE